MAPGDLMNPENKNIIRKTVQFCLGSSVIVMLFLVLAFSAPPVGKTGEVIRNNINNDIDATLLVYSDVEGVFDYGRELDSLRRAKRRSTISE